MIKNNNHDDKIFLTQEEKFLLEKSKVQEKRGKLISSNNLRKRSNL